MTGNLWQRVDEAIDTNPLRLRDIVSELLLRAKRAEARLAELENALAWQTSCTSCARGLDATIKETERAEQAEAALDRVRERLDTLIADGFGATTPTLRDVRALLDTPAPTDTTGEDRG